MANDPGPLPPPAVEPLALPAPPLLRLMKFSLEQALFELAPLNAAKLPSDFNLADVDVEPLIDDTKKAIINRATVMTIVINRYPTNDTKRPTGEP